MIVQLTILYVTTVTYTMVIYWLYSLCCTSHPCDLVFHPLSGPGALRAECKTLPPNCCLENLIISVVSWKNKEHRAVLFCLHYVFLCPVFKIIAYESVREHVRVYRIWWCPCSCNLNLLYTELSVLMCFIICLDGYYVNARGAM